MLIFLITSVVWATVVITLLVLGVVLLPLGIGVPVLVATLSIARGLGTLDRLLVNALLRGGIAAAPSSSEVARAVPADASWWRRTHTQLGDASGWRQVAWLSASPVLAGVGFSAAITAITVMFTSVGVLVVGIVSLTNPQQDWLVGLSPAQVETLSRWAIVAGLVLILLTPGFFWLLRGCAAGTRAFARWALGPSRQDQLQAATERAERAEAQVQIDQELHDSIGHMITMTVVQAGAAAHVFDSDPAFAREALRTIEERGRAAMGDLDRIIATIQGAAPRTPLPGADALDALIADARAAGVDITARVELPKALPAPVGRAVYSAVREAFTNAARHAPGAAVTLDVVMEGGDVHLRAANPVPKRKVPEARQGGQGIGGMRDRIELLGGSLEAGVTRGVFVVDARIPVDAGAVTTSSPASSPANTPPRKAKR
jgi:signal transduction histidine kinase